MVPFGAMTVAVISGHYGLPIWLGIFVALSFGVVVGLVNGFLVIKTAVPSLIVTLGSLFRGAGPRAWPDGADHQIHLGRADGRRSGQGDLWRLRAGRAVAGDGAVVAGPHGALHLLRPLQPLRKLDLRDGRRQGFRPQRRDPDRPADDDPVRPVLHLGRLCGHVPGDPLQLGAGRGRAELHLQLDHRGRRGRRALDRRLRVGGGHLLRHHHLRGGHPRHLLHRFRPELVVAHHRRPPAWARF